MTQTDSLGVVILTNTNSDSIFEMNKNCIKSLLENTSQYVKQIVLMESNKNAQYKYSDEVTVIKPDEDFNFNRFLNIGISHCDTAFYALCNNDIIFEKNWFNEILRIKLQHPEILSFCPMDYNCAHKPVSKYPDTVDFYLGADTIIPGYCIVVDKNIFKIIGDLDERFDFYYADDDYAMTIRKYNIKHAYVTKSIVTHLGGVTTKSVEKVSYKEDLIQFNLKNAKYKVPRHLYHQDYAWIVSNPRMLNGYLTFHDKWGFENLVRLKRVLCRIPFLRVRFITKLICSL